MKRLMMVWVMLLCLVPLCAWAEEEAGVPQSVDEAYSFDRFTIVEKDGKFGVLDLNGNFILPLEYYIPIDQFDSEEWPEPVCIEVYLPTDGDFDIRDLEWELYHGTVKAGFFHTESRYFSQCVWKDVFVSDKYAAVSVEENHWSLLRAETGEVILEGDQYSWIDPWVSEDWIYVDLWPEEIDEDIGPIWETVYINLDGTILTAPDGYWFSEDPEPIKDGMVVLYNGTETKTVMRVEDILEMAYDDESDDDTKDDDENDDDRDYFWETGSWPLRDLDIVTGEDGQDHLQITMHDGSGQVFLTHALPPYASFDAYHAGNESILMDYPVMELQYEDWDDAGEAETIFLTIRYADGHWRITNATNGWGWIAETENGVWRFDDWYADEERSWSWETPGKDRLTEIDFEVIERMVSLFNAARPDRPNLPEAKDREQ